MSTAFILFIASSLPLVLFLAVSLSSIQTH
ncbi:hypothetical protein EV561_12157 [Rhizobium sp. BK376]|nr:hypothetical protein EV561_12157 [Rhizobium sp. BK376]